MSPETVGLKEYMKDRFDLLDRRVDDLEDRLPGVVHWKDLAMAITTGATLIGVLAAVVL